MCRHCATRTMGDTRQDPAESLPQVTLRLLERAGFAVRIPDGIDNLCCGKAFETRDFTSAAQKIIEMEAALRMASENGRHPILCDTSPCLARTDGIMII